MRHMLIKLMLCSVVIFGLSLSAYAAENETVDTILTLVSTAPFVEQIYLDDLDNTTDAQIDLSPNATELVNCYGNVNDTDGYADLRNVTATIYSSGVGTTAYSGGEDPLHRYQNESCTLDFMNDGFFNCTFDVQYYAQNTTWTCAVNVTDFAYNSNTTSLNATNTVADLVAIDIPDSVVDFGAKSINQNYSATTNVTVWNEGNVEIDLDLDAYEANATGTLFDSPNSFNCTVGSLPVGNLRFNMTFDGNYSLSLPMQEVGFQNYSSFNLGHTTSGTDPTNTSTYWGIGLPETGLAGICTGRLIYAALASGD